MIRLFFHPSPEGQTGLAVYLRQTFYAMKSSPIILLCVLVTFTGYAQKPTIPKGASRIQVATVLSDSVLFDMITFRLESAGFFIDQSDKGKGYLITEYKNMGEAMSIKVIVGINSDTAVFSGQGAAEILGNQYTNVPLVNKGSGSGLEKSGFMVLDELVKKLSKSLGSSRISYLTAGH